MKQLSVAPFPLPRWVAVVLTALPAGRAVGKAANDTAPLGTRSGVRPFHLANP